MGGVSVGAVQCRTLKFKPTRFVLAWSGTRAPFPCHLLVSEVRPRCLVFCPCRWKYPEQVVLISGHISGHIDSWDVGQGAMDDAGWCCSGLCGDSQALERQCPAAREDGVPTLQQ